MKRTTPLIMLILLMLTARAESLEAFAGAVFSPLDELGRVGPAMAVLSPETIDNGRESIASFSPSGYRTAIYGGSQLWERCHMIGAQLAQDTEVEENLFTGTREMNHGAMLEIENAVARYIRETGNHVLYRVMPDFRGGELICRGVTISARSFEDDSLRITEYVPNVQSGVDIDYMTGFTGVAEGSYILNTHTMRFHAPDCPGVPDIKAQNRQIYSGSRDTLIEQGFTPCGTCKP